MGIFSSKPKVNDKPKPPVPKAPDGPPPVEEDSALKILVKMSNFANEDFKILILGPGESGKSTYWRQLRNIYTNGLNTKEKKALINPIRLNLISDIQTIIKFSLEYGIDINPTLENDVAVIKEIEANEMLIDDTLAGAIINVWNDPAARNVYEQIHSCALSDHSAFFLDHCKRLADQSYIPTDEDIIKSRVRTTGVNDIKFEINDKKVLLVDVGGQQCERVKWKNVFVNVNAIIFVVSLADFDQTMFEKEDERRTTDSLDLFKTTVNMPLFAKIPIFLILNKEDELRRKLKKTPDLFKEAYPDFEGNLEDVDGIIKFIEQQYISRAESREPGAEIKSFISCAIDREKMNQGFLEVADRILSIKV